MAEVDGLLPMDGARIYPVSGGSEAVETAIKMARAYHLARKDPDYLRWLSRHASGLRYRTEIYQILGRMGTSAA